MSVEAPDTITDSSDRDFVRINLFKGKTTDLHKQFQEATGWHDQEPSYYTYTSSLRREKEEEISVSLFQHKYTSSFVVSEKVTGVSPNGKSWTSWKTVAQLYLSIKPTKTGSQSLNVYGNYRMPTKWSMFKNITNDSETVSKITHDYFLDAVNQEAYRLVSTFKDVRDILPVPDGIIKLRQEVLKSPSPRLHFELVSKNSKRYLYIRDLVYPMLRHIVPAKGMFGVIDKSVGHTFGARSENHTEYAKALFGKKNARKDLAKAVSAAPDIYSLFFARNFRNFVPTDWIIAFLNETHKINFAPLSKEQEREFKRLLKVTDLKHRRRLIMDVINHEKQARENSEKHNIRHQAYPFYYFRDTLNFLPLLSDEEIQNLDFSTWEDIHDYVVHVQEERKHENLPIPETPLAKEIASLPKEGDSIQVILPEDTKTLRQWGNQMKHCIGSYSSIAANGSAVFVGFVKNNEMIGNAQFDVNSNKCLQILGKYNRVLPKEDRESIVKIFNASDVIPEQAFENAYGFHTTY